MDKGHVLQSLHMQQMIAESCPSWWNFNNMMKPPNYPQQLHNPSTNLLIPTNSTFIPHHMPPSSFSSSSSCHGNQDHLPNSWSQLLLGGVVAEEDRSCISNNIENESLEKWEEQIMPHHGLNESVKQENSTRSYIQGHGDIDQHHGVTRPTWSQLVPVSSPKSSCVTTATNLSTNMLDFSNKTEGKRSPSDHSSECNSTATGGTLKKARVQPSSSQPTFKVRKEKIGDRITALHQIVSPFGKTDAASVLLETNGYIRFLQNQVEALGLPYLSKGGANMRQKQSESIEDPKKGLKSRGLCLVPLSCTLQFQSDNNGDYCSIWGGF